MSTRSQRDRAARRAIGWGAGILLAGFVFGAMITFVPVLSGFAIGPVGGVEWWVIIGSLAVSFVGLGLLLFGLLELARSRPPKGELRREHEEWLRAPFEDEGAQSS